MSTPQKRGRANMVRARIRKAAFESLYGRFAWAYDWVSRTFFLDQWRAWQKAAIPYLRGKRVLEVGMGTGNMQIEMWKAGYQVWGVDLSPHMLRQATRKARMLRLPPFRACQARAQALPFPTGQFDSVVSTFPSDYIIEPSTLMEINRVLRPGGRLVVVPTGWLHPRGTSGKALQGVARLVYGDNRGGANAPAPADSGKTQARAWVASLESRTSEAGFAVAAHVASNERGAALVIVADKASAHQV